jgi:hypothetical protein
VRASSHGGPSQSGEHLMPIAITWTSCWYRCDQLRAGDVLAQGCRILTTRVFAILSIHPCLRGSKKAQMNPM